MANDSMSRGIDNYLEKIHCLLACLNCEEWIINANAHSIETLFNTAIEIEECMSKAEAKKILESLKIVFPEHNFTRCGDIVLETVLVHPQTPGKTLIFALDKYLGIYNMNSLCDLLFRLMQGKKIKDQAMSIINNYKDGALLQTFEARCCLHLCEQMIVEKDSNFETYVKELLEKETPLCFNSLMISNNETGHVISQIIVKHLNNDQDMKLWFTILGQKNIKITNFLCSHYPEMMNALLTFFDRYAAEAEFQMVEPFSWKHKLIPLNEFVDILDFLLKNDGVVGTTINDFITKKITDLKDNSSFWLDVKTLL